MATESGKKQGEPMKSPWNTALGFYQNLKTAENVLNKLRKEGFTHSIIIHRDHYGNISTKGWGRALAQPFVYNILAFVGFILSFLLNFPLSIMYPMFIGVVLVLLLWYSCVFYLYKIDTPILKKFKTLVISDETLVLVQIHSKDVPKALSILRHVESGHPTSFLLRSGSTEIKTQAEFNKEPLTFEALVEHARQMAGALGPIDHRKLKGVPLLKNLRQCEKSLNEIRHVIEEAEFVEQTITISAEWLLDNAYVIQGNVEEVLRNLPQKFYRELPKISQGPDQGLPRIYCIAKDIVQSTANRLDSENIVAYLNAYQSITPLKLGELWVLPLMLRLRLIECLNVLALDIDRRLKEGENASFWGNRLLNVSKREPEKLNDFLNALKLEQPYPSSHFAEELIDHLYDEEKIIPLVRAWFEEKLNKNINEIFKDEQLQKTSEQVSISSAIVSLITLSQLSWRDIFESVNLIDKILEKDPAGIYNKMDFTSRDNYRHEVEILSRGSKYSETEIAARALQQAEHGKGPIASHVGYYLVDQGKQDFKKMLGYQPDWAHFFRQKIMRHPSLLYFGSILILILSIEWVLASILSLGGVEIGPKILLLIFSLLPASELCIQFLNIFAAKILHPSILPKLSFENAVPENLKTLIVVPSLLISEENINENVSQIEIHYLANSDKAFKFGIFYDHVDAPQKQMQNDQRLLEFAINKIQSLETKYGAGKFFLFFRDRSWSQSESAWIGRERKRGKLECLNEFLMEENCPELILKVGRKEDLAGIKYVITLDADTSLPKEVARKLVETISHPLNTPIMGKDGKLIRGYTIIQPRIGTDLACARSTFFTQIFSDVQSANPYTQAVSDVYQDLMSEGSYHGKAIYDVASFYKILHHIFPNEHILSHDLIEGVHARVGYASDIVLSDMFPQDYSVWSKRQHRWIRGDWQIIDWIFSFVPSQGKEKIKNALSYFSRWKIFDNLRRSLVPIASLLLLLTAFFTSSQAWFWSLFIFIAYLGPVICMMSLNAIGGLKKLYFSRKDLWHQAIRTLINLALLPQQAYVSFDAIMRVAYRRRISKKKLLEWETFSPLSTTKGHKKFIQNLYWISLFALLLFGIILLINPSAMLAAGSYCLIWALAPLTVAILDKPRLAEPSDQFTAEENRFLRAIARRTWRYFDDFVGPQTNWLPPDNYQSALNVEVAMRTSPTNIGLWMLAVTAAHDFKYITTDDVIDRLTATFRSFKKLEMYEGHFLNWYDIQTLKPLFPRYVSTVDSGNLLASFWTLEQAIYQIANESLLSNSIFKGLKDTFEMGDPGPEKTKEITSLNALRELLNRSYSSLYEIQGFLDKSLDFVQEVLTQKFDDHQMYWFKQLQEELFSWSSISKRYFSWLHLLKKTSKEELEGLHPDALMWLKEIEDEEFSLKEIASGEMPKPLQQLLKSLDEKSKDSTLYKALLNQIDENYRTAQWLAGEKLGEINEILSDLNTLCDGLNMRFLYNEERKLFSIGYQVDNCRLDSSYYDLLASEARIASFVAIAKDDVPLEHWWALGRPYGYLYGRDVLMSWGGTMFEYLMPLLFKNIYPDSLMTEACRNAVACQRIYGDKRGIPWGISEAAFSAIDTHKIYQYRSFGVPGLGFKRGLEEDLVVSPYSTALALSIDPKAALQNLKRLESKRYDLLGDYGYYESIDFTRQQARHGERGVVVYAFMAHHQGMSLLAIDNVLNNNILRKRFHANPRICGMESLLYEKAPVFPTIAKGSRKTIPISRLPPFPAVPIMGIAETPHGSAPKVNILSNGVYSVMITNSGGGYSTWKDFDITRWRADVTLDNWGSFCYIKDVHSGDFWSVGFHPTCRRSKKYTVSFKADRTEIQRLDAQMETDLEVVVSPEDDAEIRLLTLANLSKQKREIELTSYSELALAPHAADAAHPSFNKMFIETEALQDLPAVLAFRRLRGPEDRPLFAGHIVAGHETSLQAIQFETDRLKFIGRGRTLNYPASMDGKLSNSQGYVLDPIFSLRYRISLAPGQRQQVAFITVVSESREKTIALLKKYTDPSLSHRAIEMAWAHAQLELRHLRIHQEEAQLFQKLASRILYPHAQLRPSADRLIRNRRGQSYLWAYGISGDLPIVVVSIADIHEIDLVKQIVTAHIFWRLRGLKTDLIILNDEVSGYEHPLFEQLQRLLQGLSNQIEIGKSGGVYLLNSDQIPEEDLILILSVARVNLVAARGSLRQQLVAPLEATTYPPRLIPDPKAKEHPSAPLPFVALDFFNGVGGFSPDGREYMIFLDAHVQTPAPWINVIANSNFGTMVSEAGLGMTWYGNSQTNRLTPWSNDPVLNPIADTIYIRDEDLGIFWTPTPAPIRELDPYRIRHGQGYSRFEHNSHGIEQDLTVFVPFDEHEGLPVRVQRLKLKNQSSVKRKLSVFAYTEWILGIDREKSQLHIVTEWDAESQALFGFNRYNPDYGNHLAFACSIPLPSSYTCNRTEFIGRNGHPSSPVALKRKKLSSLTGAAFDPCAALQVMVELNPNEEKEIVFLLGYAENTESARELIVQCRESGWVQKSYLGTLSWWDKFLSAFYVQTPDREINHAFNRWLLYQNLSCRFWGRSAFYQSSGAFGFRDQLQDAMALLYASPYLARKQILLAASRQFLEGDVQHWWHPPANGGVRTRISDDLLWLPFVTAQYIRVTRDISILHEVVPFIKGELLKDDQHEAYFIPEVSDETATLMEHCRRALQKGLTKGPHGLPLMGGGDWNDGMNRVGIEGRGESVWLAWFLVHVMNDFADLLAWSGQPGSDEGFRAQAKRLAEIIEESAWDGQWYKRAYFDDGTPLGSKENKEDTIDSLPQSWAVISKSGNSERVRTAFKALEEYLIKNQEKIVLLLTPPFDKTDKDPGYIKGYPPGVRENGGQYTHGSLWVPLAYAMLGDGTKAVELIKMMHPIAHSSSKNEMMHFKVEPYVLAADIYSLPGQVGRGGWTWYTGSAGWMYRILLEEIFGFKLRGDKLTIRPVLPKDWDKIVLHYQYHTSRYDIHIDNSPAINPHEVLVELDGVAQEREEISLVNDGKVHQVIIKARKVV